MRAQAYYTAGRGAPPPRSGPDHASIAPYGLFQTRDGGPVYVGVQNAREWTRFCADVLHRPDLADDERFRTNSLRVQHRPALHAAVEAVFATLSAGEILARLETAQIASARLNDMAGFLAHPQLVDRGRWREVGSPAGPVPALVPPVAIDGVDPVMGPVPALGEHTDAILRELGFADGIIDDWRKDGVI
jgi:itaconate CoA-transferase